jgi:hypothetical protein
MLIASTRAAQVAATNLFVPGSLVKTTFRHSSNTSGMSRTAIVIGS